MRVYDIIIKKKIIIQKKFLTGCINGFFGRYRDFFLFKSLFTESSSSYIPSASLISFESMRANTDSFQNEPSGRADSQFYGVYLGFCYSETRCVWTEYTTLSDFLNILPSCRDAFYCWNYFQRTNQTAAKIDTFIPWLSKKNPCLVKNFP